LSHDVKKKRKRGQRNVRNEPSSLENILISAAIPVDNSHPIPRTRQKHGVLQNRKTTQENARKGAQISTGNFTRATRLTLPHQITVT
jgi:hypothetical protein